jgi:hypothetical protein
MSNHLTTTGAGGSARPLLSDAFTDANGTALGSHTMDQGGGWTAHNGGWDVQANRANAAGADPGGPGWTATAAAGQTDAIVQAVVNALSAGAGLIGRFTDNDNFWLLAVEPAPSDTLRLYERSAGSWVIRAGTAFPSATGTDYTLRLTLWQDKFAGLADGILKLEYEGSGTTGPTRHGLYAGGAGDRLDTFRTLAL